MPPDSTWLELNDDVGVTADGNLEPLVVVGLAKTVPAMLADPATGKQEIGEETATATIESADQISGAAIIRARVVPGTRMVESADPEITVTLIGCGNWHEIDPPTKTAAKQQAKALTDAVQEAGTHSDPDNPEG